MLMLLKVPKWATMSTMGSELVGAAEVCELLRIGRSTLQRWATNGTLPAVTQAPGKTGPRLFDRTTVKELAAQRGERTDSAMSA
jgi:excisionase family DNA binding protein